MSAAASGPVRHRLSPRNRSRIIAFAVVVYVALVAVGGVIGYHAADGSRRWFAAFVGALAGMVGYVVLVWILAFFLRSRIDTNPD